MPIIAISGCDTQFQGMANILQIAQSLGADMAMRKPTDTEELLQRHCNTLTEKRANNRLQIGLDRSG